MDNLRDYEIVTFIRKGKTEFVPVLYKRYKVLARQLTRCYLATNFGNGVSFDDIYSYAFESIDIALNHFDPEVSESFYSYWRTIAAHEIEDMLKAETYSGEAKAFYGVSLDSIAYGDQCYSEIIGVSESYESDEEVLIRFKKLFRNPKNKFSKAEQIILSGLAEGKSHTVIRKKLGITQPTYRYHYMNAVNKLKKILEKV